MRQSFSCPKCGCKLVRSSEVVIDGGTFPVFQCENCKVSCNVGGETHQVAYKFAVTALGVVFDPATDYPP